MSGLRFTKLIDSSIMANLFEAVLNKNKIQHDYEIIGDECEPVFEFTLDIKHFMRVEELINEHKIDVCLFKTST